MARERPVRFFFGQVVYRLIWWPMIGLAIPFGLVGLIFELCSDRLFPRIAEVVQPLFAGVHNFALMCGHAVWGVPLQKDQTP